MRDERLLQDEIEVERYELFETSPYRFELERRDFFKLLGAGMVVACVWKPAAAIQESGRQRRGQGGSIPQEIGAWLHIGEDGAVKVFTGKVEIGQNARTSLTQSVAEELRVPVTSIEMVMGDTDLTPFDQGTFGSRTTPTMAPQLRKVAAAAREILAGLAADAWKVDRSALTVKDGKVSHAASKRSITFGELNKGQKIVKIVASDAKLTPATDWKVSGHSIPKVDGRPIVTGKHRYSPDVTQPGLLHGKIVRPSAFNASLVSADTKAAEAMAGVTVVRDGNFIGVAAPDPSTAERAASAIRAEWKAPEQVSSKDLFEHLKKTARSGGRGGRGGTQEGAGVEEALASASKKLQQTYTVAYIAHAPLEPRAAVADWKDGKLTVWTGSQRPFGVHGELAEAFHLPGEQVRVIVPDTGSGYGGKHTGDAAIEAARLAKAAGKPVKVVWTREEEFTWAYFRPAGVIEVSSGVRDDGIITAWDFHNYNSGPSGIEGKYEIAHQRNEFHQSDSPLRQGSYRGLAATANHFAREVHIDELAHMLKMDPMAFRLKNIKDERLCAVIEAAAEAFGWGRRKPARGTGAGMACGFEKGGYIATFAEVAADRSSGKVKILRAVSSFECGAIVNPEHLKNQVDGSIAMGIGGALFEAIEFENGKILNPHFAQYRVPRFSDMPAIESILIDRKDIPSAGAGETPIVGIAPAIGNAIFDATGIRLRSLPMIPDGLKT